MTFLPETMEEVTPSWLQQAVKDHPAFRGKRISSARGKPIGEGIGQMSALARVELAYDGEPGPQSVVVKLHAPFQAMRDVGIRYEMFAREAAFYQTLAAEVTVPIPTVYFAAWDPVLARNAMVMQDMTAWHWPDQLAGATQQQAERCIDALAKLGARHWGADFSRHPWLPDTHAPVLRQVVDDYRQSVPHALERLHSFVSPEAGKACKRIMHNMDWLCEKLAEPPLILTHYDSRLENFVFADPSAAELALIDWQLMARLRPGWDFAYFLGTSVSETRRSRWQPALSARYLDGLRANGVRNYDAARFDYDFRLSTMAITVIPVIGGASFDVSNERSLALFGAIMLRSLTSVLENDCLALLPA
jgi:thiamine kinase-like enzyme